MCRDCMLYQNAIAKAMAEGDTAMLTALQNDYNAHLATHDESSASYDLDRPTHIGKEEKNGKGKGH